MLRGTRWQYVRRAQYFLLVDALLGVNVVALFIIVGLGVWRRPVAYVLLLLANIFFVVRWRSQQRDAKRRAELKSNKLSES